jgi:hypothetical protein
LKAQNVLKPIPKTFFSNELLNQKAINDRLIGLLDKQQDQKKLLHPRKVLFKPIKA